MIGATAALLLLMSSPAALAGTPNPQGQAEASSLQQECKQALLAFPAVLNKVGEHRTEMFNPGKLHQFVVVALQFAAAPPNCGSFQRIDKASVELANARHHNQLVDLGDFPYSGNQGEEDGGVLSQSDHTTTDNYKCTPGPGKTPVWIKFQNKVKNLTNGRIIGTKQGKKRIEVEGGGC